MPWERSVFSKMVQTVGYDEETEELLITWAKNGRVSAFQGVPEEMADTLAKAPSVGTMFNMDIKGRYPHRYVR